PYICRYSGFVDQPKQKGANGGLPVANVLAPSPGRSMAHDDSRGTHSVAASQAWSPPVCDQVMRRCVRCCSFWIAAMATALGDAGHNNLPTEFNHYDGAVAYTLGLQESRERARRQRPIGSRDIRHYRKILSWDSRASQAVCSPAPSTQRESDFLLLAAV